MSAPEKFLLLIKLEECEIMSELGEQVDLKTTERHESREISFTCMSSKPSLR